MRGGLLFLLVLLAGCPEEGDKRDDPPPQDHDYAYFVSPRDPPRIPRPEEIDQIKKDKIDDFDTAAWNYRNIASARISQARHAGRLRDACNARNEYHRHLQRICDQSKEMGLDVDCGEVPIKDCAELPNQTIPTPELRTEPE